jgi:hypothetical protein
MVSRKIFFRFRLLNLFALSLIIFLSISFLGNSWLIQDYELFIFSSLEIIIIAIVSFLLDFFIIYFISPKITRNILELLIFIVFLYVLIEYYF